MSTSHLDGTSAAPYINFEDRSVGELLSSLSINRSKLETSLTNILGSLEHTASIVSLKDRQARILLGLLQFVSQMPRCLPSLTSLQVVDNAKSQPLVLSSRKMLIKLSRSS